MNEDWREIEGADRNTVTVDNIAYGSSWEEISQAFEAIQNEGFIITRLGSELFGMGAGGYDESFVIPETVRVVGYDNDSVTEPNYWSDNPGPFAGAQIEGIVIPSGLRRLEARAFYGCRFERVVFEEGSQLEYIGDSAF
ncbi:MAG: leucine-rich repeat domain-containing protein, partial [Peptococcaceae bacterium]|nr:leucine-rich repeat domain-containing protein [Peptococcaceae bacterium]